MAADQPTLRIARVEVQGLFGLFDHVIELKLAERVTVLHGPNGVGKTTLLRMIAALLNGDVNTFANIPFTKFHVSCENGPLLEVTSETITDDEGVTSDR